MAVLETMEARTKIIFTGQCALIPVAAAIVLLVATPVFGGSSGWTFLAAATLAIALVIPFILSKTCARSIRTS